MEDNEIASILAYRGNILFKVLTLRLILVLLSILSIISCCIRAFVLKICVMLLILIFNRLDIGKEVTSSNESLFDKIIDFGISSGAVIAISELKSETLEVHYFPLEHQSAYRSFSINETININFSSLSTIEIIKGSFEYLSYDIIKEIYYYFKFSDPIICLPTIKSWYYCYKEIDNETHNQKGDEAPTELKVDKYLTLMGPIFDTKHQSIQVFFTQFRFKLSDFPDEKLITMLPLQYKNGNGTTIVLHFEETTWIYERSEQGNACIEKIYNHPVAQIRIINPCERYVILWKKGTNKAEFRKRIE